MVVKPYNRGSFEDVLDTLIFSAGYKSFDPDFCALSNGDLCSISSVKVPLSFVNQKANDTLHVVKDGKVTFFKVPVTRITTLVDNHHARIVSHHFL
jgi:hypothetical protein